MADSFSFFEAAREISQLLALELERLPNALQIKEAVKPMSRSEFLAFIADIKAGYLAYYERVPEYVPRLINFTVGRRMLGSGFLQNEICDIFGIQHIFMLYSEQAEVSEQELYSYDGNTIRKLEGSSGSLSNSSGPTKYLDVQIWLSEKEDPYIVLLALSDLLAEAGLLYYSSEVPQYKSFFQALVFCGKATKNYSKSLLSNLKTAFGDISVAQKIDSAAKLSKVLEKSSNAVLRVGNFIAVKTTRDRKTYVLVMEMNEILERRLNSAPNLIRDHSALYALLTEFGGTASMTQERSKEGVVDAPTNGN